MKVKREEDPNSNRHYSNVVGNDIYNHYGLFFWQTCWFCDKEFRREAGYRFQVQYNAPWVYSCSDCSCSKSHCNDNVKVHKLNMRKGYFPVPPPMRSYKNDWPETPFQESTTI